MLALWLKFLLSAFLIVIAGIGLTKSADTISRRTGLGVLWAGVFLLAVATSMPELVTSWRAAAIDAPDLAVGNIFGSNMFNITIIALIDLSQGYMPLLARVSQRHIFTASMVILLTAFVSLFMLWPTPIRIGWLGLETVAVMVFYLLGNLLLARFERKHASENFHNNESTGYFQPVTQALLMFLLSTLIIVIAGTSLADTGELIAQRTGLSQTLFGSFFIAITTSLPELVTTFTAVRLGILDMAIGNLFGSCFFNLSILFFVDLFYKRGPVMHFIGDGHMITAMMSIILTTLAVMGLIYRSQRSFLRLGYDSAAIVVLYVITISLLFLVGS